MGEMVASIGHFSPTSTPTVAFTPPASNFAPRNFPSQKLPTSPSHQKSPFFSHFSKTPLLPFSPQNGRKIWTHFPLQAAASPSVGKAEYTEEPAAGVKFLKTVNVPDCSSSLSLLGTGYREKIFAIIGVKVYAAGFYVNPSVLNEVNPGKGRSTAEIEQDMALFHSIYQSSLEKSLQIVLVRDVDGKTFWDALDEAVAPRVAAPTPVDESALSTFRSIFQGRSLKKGTSILLTWLEPSKMLVSVAAVGLPEKVDARIESMNVTRALFDVFFGESPVSPSLKASVASGLATTLY